MPLRGLTRNANSEGRVKIGLKRRDIVAPPVKGWRAFTLHADGRLAAQSRSYVYAHRIAVDIDPRNSGTRGFWCYKSKITARNRTAASEVLGKVRLYGHIVEHQRGYRAEILVLDGLVNLRPYTVTAAFQTALTRYGVADLTPKVKA